MDSTLGIYNNPVGFTGSPTKNGTGDWTLTYAPALDTDTNNVQGTVQDQGGGGSRGNITIQKISDTQIRVRTFVGGAPSDQHFWITISRVIAP